MKKLFVLVLAAFMAVSAHAKLGIIGGLTSSKTNIKESMADIQNINQFHVGVAYNLPLVAGFAIQPALQYNIKGARIADVSGLKNLSLDFQTGFIEVPVQVQWGIDLKVCRPYVFAEPFIGLAVNNKTVTGEKVSTSWDNVYNRLEYGAGLGVGVDFLGHIQVSVRYFWNMGNIYDSKITFSSVTGTISDNKCNGVMATLGIFF